MDTDSQSTNSKNTVSVPIPNKNSFFDRTTSAHDYYQYYSFFYSDENDYISAQTSWFDCSFTFTKNTATSYFSAYGCEKKDYFLNRFLNPFFGFRYEVQLDATNTTYQVVFTNGTKTFIPTPNATQTYHGDGSFVVVDMAGNSKYYFPYT